MRRSDQPTERQADASNTITFDNDTMVEVLKHLNYCQLAKSSLVSKRYRGLIQKNRHKMARLYVSHIIMRYMPNASGEIYMFDKVLSREAYDEWVVRNHYSKQLPLESQMNELQSTQNERKFYLLWASADYEVELNPSNVGTMNVLHATVELSHENWPLFQHFVRLLTDPFIIIWRLELVTQDILSSLAGAIMLDHNRVKCDLLSLNHRGNTHDTITWIKDHVLYREFRISANNVSNYYKVLLELFMTGANCTSEIRIGDLDLCDVVVGFVKKFMDLKSGDENQFVESIKGKVLNGNVEGLKRSIAEFVAKEEEDRHSSILEFVNNDIGKKLLLIIENGRFRGHYMLNISIKINNM